MSNILYYLLTIFDGNKIERERITEMILICIVGR